jgi:hypothetical protein
MIKKYKNIWLLLIDLTATEGKDFNDLIDVENENTDVYQGAWVNVLIKSETRKLAIKLAPRGLQELGFIVKEIDTIENLEFLLEKDEVTEDVVSDADWLISSKYVFMISDKLFPYI